MTLRGGAHVLQLDCAVNVEDGTVRRMWNCITAESRVRFFWGIQVNEHHPLGNEPPWGLIQLRGLVEEVVQETVRTPQGDLWHE